MRRTVAALALGIVLTACSAEDSTPPTSDSTVEFADLRIEAKYRSAPKKAEETIYDYTVTGNELTIQKTVTDVNGNTHDGGTERRELSDEQMAEISALAQAFVDDPTQKTICTDIADFRLMVADGDDVLAELDALPCYTSNGSPFVAMHDYIRELHRNR